MRVPPGDETGHTGYVISTPLPHFDPGALCLEFAYSGSLGEVPEQWHAPHDLSEWVEARFGNLGPLAADATERELVDAIVLRDAIATVTLDYTARRDLTPDAVDTVNLFAATPDIPPLLAGGRRQAGHTSVRIGHALSTVARDAVRLLTADNTDRVRECAADDCALVFYDESRSTNRRWCSMQRCGNVAKVRAHRARQRLIG